MRLNISNEMLLIVVHISDPYVAAEKKMAVTILVLVTKEIDLSFQIVPKLVIAVGPTYLPRVILLLIYIDL